MSRVMFTIERLKAMPRPPEYLTDLAKCALEQTETAMTFEDSSDCYQQLKNKYANYQPTREELQRAKEYEVKQQQNQKAQTRQQLIAARQAGAAQNASAAGGTPAAGCGGCRGRKINT